MFSRLHQPGRIFRKLVSSDVKNPNHRTSPFWGSYLIHLYVTLAKVSQSKYQNQYPIDVCGSPTEAEYTFQLKKPILPLVLQRHYKADGWLGIMMGAKFYVNFDGKYEFEQAFSMLVRELDGRGKLPSGQTSQGQLTKHLYFAVACLLTTTCSLSKQTSVVS